MSKSGRWDRNGVQIQTISKSRILYFFNSIYKSIHSYNLGYYHITFIFLFILQRYNNCISVCFIRFYTFSWCCLKTGTS